MDKLDLSTPWVTFAKKIKTMFEKDPEVNVVYSNNDVEVKLYVDNYAKADALSAILPTEKTFGNVVLKITVVPSNVTLNRVTLFRNAFANNPILNRVETVHPTQDSSINYFIFNRDVISFFNDDLSDFYGMESTLAEDIAREIFDIEDEAIFFCTEIEES